MANPKSLREATAPNLILPLAELLGSPTGGEILVTDAVFSRDGALQLTVHLENPSLQAAAH